MRALILVADDPAATPADTPPDPQLAATLDPQLQALAAAGFREIVTAGSPAGTNPDDALGDGSRWGLSLSHCDGAGGEGIDRALPLLGGGPFALLYARVRTDYPLTRLRAVKCDWAHLVLVPARDTAAEARFPLQGARIIDGAAGPDAPVFAGIAVCHPRLFTGRTGSLLDCVRQAARDHLVTAEIWRGAWSDGSAIG